MLEPLTRRDRWELMMPQFDTSESGDPTPTLVWLDEIERVNGEQPYPLTVFMEDANLHTVDPETGSIIPCLDPTCPCNL